jgi:hypothetical protein
MDDQKVVHEVPRFRRTMMVGHFVAWLARKPKDWTPTGAMDAPGEIVLIGVCGSRGDLEHAQTVARASNEEELCTPVGAWCIVRSAEKDGYLATGRLLAGTTCKRVASAPALVFE